MMMKLLMSWDIKTGREQPYFEFIVREFAPKLMRLGLQPTEAWYTVYGAGPQIIMPGIATDRLSLDTAMQSEEWQSLTARLQNFVTDYRCRILS